MVPEMPTAPSPSRRSSGQSVVEFTLTLPLLLMLLMAVLESGFFVYRWSALTSAVSHGARLAAIREADQTMVVNAIQTRAAPAMAVQASDISLTVDSGSTPFSSRTHGQRLQVTATAPYAPLFSVVFGSGPTVPLTGRTETMVE